MHALSESGSFRSPSVLARHFSVPGSPRGRRSSELANEHTIDFDGRERRSSLDKHSARTIEEESEPSSLESLHKVVPERLQRPKSSTSSQLPAGPAANGGPDLATHLDHRRSSDDHHGASETSSLLPKAKPSKKSRSKKHYGATTAADVEDQRQGLRSRPAKFWHGVSGATHSAAESLKWATNPKSWDRKAIIQTAIVEPATSLPAVFLGLLLNVLDGLSYGECFLPRPMFLQHHSIHLDVDAFVLKLLGRMLLGFPTYCCGALVDYQVVQD